MAGSLHAQPADNAPTGYSCASHYTFTPGSDVYTDLPPGLLWRVQAGPDNPPSYVFGTFHSATPVIAGKLEKIRTIYPQIRTVALELLLSDPQVKQRFQQAMLLPDGQTLQGRIGRERYSDATQALRAYGITPDAANGLQVWAVAVILSMSPEEFASSETLDGFIEQDAMQRGKSLVSLETVEEQIMLFDSLTAEQQSVFLDASLAMLEERDALIEAMKKLYADEQLEALDDMSDAMMTDGSGDTTMQDWVDEHLLGARNALMVERMMPLLQAGGALVAVGALHLPGEDGVLYALERQGYCLHPVE